MNLPLLFIGALEMIVVLFFVLGPLILVIWALVDIFKRDFRYKTTDRILLIILIVFAPFIGSILYFLFLRTKYPLQTIR